MLIRLVFLAWFSVFHWDVCAEERVLRHSGDLSTITQLLKPSRLHCKNNIMSKQNPFSKGKFLSGKYMVTLTNDKYLQIHKR